MKNFFEHLRGVLSRDDRFIDRDAKTLLRNKIVEAATLYDENLLTLLLDDDTTRENFFVDAAGVKVFKQNLFVQVVNGHEFLDDSFTRFAQNIGLVDEHDNPIFKTGNVALVFPYKDCLLEGGQTKDDERRAEIFFNATLAQDDVDRLLAPKVFTNAVRYDEHGSAPATDFRESDNLIVKGNNLLALASLAERFRGKVKAVYIDPPYNTGNDGFNYNDRFNHSTWLTFMTNRLTLARQLLADDGSIWISIDDDEQAYLKVLADEIFKRDNFVATVIWEKKYSPQNDATWLSDSHDFILVYAKNKTKWRPNLLPRTEEMDARYKNPDNDPRGAWQSDNCLRKDVQLSGLFTIRTPAGRLCNPPPGTSWRFSQQKYLEMLADNRIWFGASGNGVPRIKRFLSEVQGGSVCKTIWTRDEVGDNQDGKRELLELDLLFGTPKPERLLERILTLATNAGDLVLDFFIGSGTTAAVAHKMGRRYIGVEQLDYVQTLTVERLKKVIGGEQGGISERVGWQGGGSFVYCELARLNQAFVDEIARATDSATLDDLRGRIVESGYINYKVDAAQIDADAFAALTLDEQKRVLIALLDMNMLYVSLCDMDDADFAITDADKQFTRSFYCP